IGRRCCVRSFPYPPLFRSVNGALAGLAGVLFAARYGTVDSTVGFGMELQVVAAAVVGGVAIAGGVGTVYGAALGAILLTTITARSEEHTSELQSRFELVCR